MTSSAKTSADPWNRYSRLRVADDRARGAQGRLYWDWYQRIGPGAEVLGDAADANIADLGAGTGRQAAHIARFLGARLVTAIDASQAQITRGRGLFGDVQGLEFAHADVVTALRAMPASLDAAYSCFGAVDFTDPYVLLPVIATALRPGGTLVISTLAHYTGGRPPETDVRPATIPVRLDDGTQATLQRWVLDTPVWEKLLSEAGFTCQITDVLRDPGTDAQPPMATTLIRAVRA